MKRLTLTVSALAVGLGGSAFAQEAEQSPNEAIELERLVVTTPLRRESSLERSTSSVTVIDEEEINRSAAIDLPGLLKSYTGLTVTSNGGLGSSSGVGIRGTSAAQTLILINGVSARSATLGTTSLFNIPLDSIERIEVAKGAHSAQYGSDAIGGVINIITKSGGSCPTGNPVCTTLTTGVTDPWGGHLGANVRGQSDGGTRFAFGGRIIGTRGYDFTTTPVELDDDGFLQGSFDFNVSHDFDWGQIYTSGLYSRARNEYDNTFGNDDQTDSDLFAGKIGTRINHDETWSSTVELSSGIDTSRNFGEGAPDTFFDTYRYGIFASTQKSFDTGDFGHVISFGGEAMRDRVDSTTDYDVKSRDVAAVFAQHTLEFGALTTDAGIRYDHNEQFGEATTYNLGASYEFVQGLVGRASYGTGFRAPTFNDLYFPGFGNPNLQPETSKTYEVGVNWQALPGTSLDVAFYQTWLKGAFDPLATGVVNIPRAKITGVEANLAHRFSDRWHGRLGVEFRDPRDEDTGLYLRRQERFKASAELGFRATEDLDLNARLLYAGVRDDQYFDDTTFTSVRTELPAYVTLDLAAIYRVDDLSELKVSVENIFDEDYGTAYGYRAPGRTVNVSFSRTF